jgi:hypothetical protein
MAILTKDGLKTLLDRNVRGDSSFKRAAFAANQDLVDMITTPAYHPVNASNAVTLTEDTTVGMANHGFHPIIVTGTTTVTLPAVTAHHAYWIINGNPSGTGLLTISPNASDKFLFDAAGAAGTDGKDIINTQATAKRGDYVKLIYGSADGWIITEMHGTWVDEA